MGDLPLRTPMDRCHGGPLPRRQANPTHPHPVSSFMPPPCGGGTYRALILISKGCARAQGRLDTRCSPIRRSPAPCASTQPAAPRLACVRPVASVHPEPGSNSSLYNVLCVFRRKADVCPARLSCSIVFSSCFMCRMRGRKGSCPAARICLAQRRGLRKSPQGGAGSAVHVVQCSQNVKELLRLSGRGNLRSSLKASAKVGTFRNTAKF